MWGQLWYLSEELVVRAFFDRDVDTSEKHGIVEALSYTREMELLKRIFSPSPMSMTKDWEFVKEDILKSL